MKENQGWLEEKRSAWLYGILAELEAGSSVGILFAKLKEEAEKQANIWETARWQAGEKVPKEYRPDLRSRFVAMLLRRLGPRAMKPILAAMKIRGLSVYSSFPTIHPVPRSLKDVGRRHHGGGSSGILRASIFGINDGLVSNASLILGVAGASSHHGFILLSGIAGLLAGAFSMGAGEYLSVRSQREMFEYQIGLEKAELHEYPEEEAAELALIYQAKGMSPEESRQFSQKLIGEPRQALDTLAKEELGLNPAELGSPWGAALFSFLSFSIGAMVPLLPFFFVHGENGLKTSIGLTAGTLFLVGASLSLFTGRSAFKGGIRMLWIGGAAGAITFLIGKLLGISLT